MPGCYRRGYTVDGLDPAAMRAAREVCAGWTVLARAPGPQDWPLEGGIQAQPRASGSESLALSAPAPRHPSREPRQAWWRAIDSESAAVTNARRTAAPPGPDAFMAAVSRRPPPPLGERASVRTSDTTFTTNGGATVPTNSGPPQASRAGFGNRQAGSSFGCLRGVRVSGVIPLCEGADALLSGVLSAPNLRRSRSIGGNPPSLHAHAPKARGLRPVWGLQQVRKRRIVTMDRSARPVGNVRPPAQGRAQAQKRSSMIRVGPGCVRGM